MYSITKRLNSKHWQDKVAAFLFVITSVSLIAMITVPFLYFNVYNLEENYGTARFWFFYIATFLFLMRNIHILSDFRSVKNIHIGELNYSINNINPAKTTLMGNLGKWVIDDFEEFFPIFAIVFCSSVIVFSIIVNISQTSIPSIILFLFYNFFLLLINSILFRITNTVVVPEEEIILLGKSNNITDDEAEQIKKKLKKVIKADGYVKRFDIIELYYSMFDNDEFKNRKKKSENISKYSNYLKR